MIAATRSALAADGDLLNADELAAIETLIAALASAVATGSATDIETATQALAKGTEPFAAQRMNRGIQQALAGRKVEEV